MSCDERVPGRRIRQRNRVAVALGSISPTVAYDENYGTFWQLDSRMGDWLTPNLTSPSRRPIMASPRRKIVYASVLAVTLVSAIAASSHATAATGNGKSERVAPITGLFENPDAAIRF